MPIPRLAVKGVAALSGGASAASTVRRASRGGGSCVGSMKCQTSARAARCFGDMFFAIGRGNPSPLHPHDARETRCSGASAPALSSLIAFYAGSQGSQVVARCSTGTSRMANMAGMHVRVHGPLGGLPRVQLSGVRDALRCVDTDSRFGLRASPACC